MKLVRLGLVLTLTCCGAAEIQAAGWKASLRHLGRATGWGSGDGYHAGNPRIWPGADIGWWNAPPAVPGTVWDYRGTVQPLDSRELVPPPAPDQSLEPVEPRAPVYDPAALRPSR